MTFFFTSICALFSSRAEGLLVLMQYTIISAPQLKASQENLSSVYSLQETDHSQRYKSSISAQYHYCHSNIYKPLETLKPTPDI